MVDDRESNECELRHRDGKLKCLVPQRGISLTVSVSTLGKSIYTGYLILQRACFSCDAVGRNAQNLDTDTRPNDLLLASVFFSWK